MQTIKLRESLPLVPPLLVGLLVEVLDLGKHPCRNIVLMFCFLTSFLGCRFGRFWCLSIQNAISHLLQQLSHFGDVGMSGGSLVLVRRSLGLRGRHVVLTKQAK